ncbi:MAG TPA: DUF397 domain-containing protein [Streptosporangiaceae bacterium]|nr:DUF397 domain-containing protein [Streptosporangiaceae bacterium]
MGWAGRGAQQAGDHAGGGGCVEVTRTAEVVAAVRDSKDPDGPGSPATWRRPTSMQPRRSASPPPAA